MAVDWPTRRRAAAWYIRAGRRLKWAHRKFSGEISREDNNRIFEDARHLIATGRRIAMGYEMETWTEAIYRAHLRATRPRRAPVDTLPPMTHRQRKRDSAAAASTARLMTEQQASSFIGFSVRTLQGWRIKGVGPVFVRASARAIRYSQGDLEAWIDDHRVGSTWSGKIAENARPRDE